MKDNQKKYLDKVVSLLVRETEIDYDQEVVKVSFLPYFLTPSHSYRLFSTYRPHISFSKYCKDTYGLVGDEMKYVWYQYRTILKEKLGDER